MAFKKFRRIAGAMMFALAASTVTAAAQNANLNQSGYYLLSTQLGGSTIVLTASSGDPVSMADANGSSSQRWQFSDAGNGYYRMKVASRGSGICLDVYNGGDRNNFGRLWGCEDYTGQYWLVTGSNGAYRLTTEFRGQSMCLRAFRNGGVGVQLTRCNNSEGQLWTLTPG